MIYTGLLDNFEKNRVPYYDGDETTDEEILRKKLDGYELSPLKIDVIIDRLVRGKTFREIAIDNGYSGAPSAERSYKDAIRQLQKRGYKGKE